MKPRGSVSSKWTPQLAYALGLLTTDGCVSSNGRHVTLTSKDKEQIDNFKACIHINNTIGRIARSAGEEKKYFRI